ncbi:MAG: hypothetical protein FWH23_05850 [Bacteroidales bacterium]|nr:hypothetical protein [Bacteroidales bacterium]MCL2133003.1 hypothetical protein [Bacteroidales bacterium]
MKHWIRNILGNRTETQPMLWRTDNSIFNFLSNNIDNHGNLKDTALDLPDEIKDEEKLRYAPGLMDAMFGADDSDDSKKRIIELAKHLKKVANVGSEINKQEFYKLITEDESVIGIIDDFLQAIVKNPLSVEPYLFSFARDLASKTDKRNAVKFGIAILGLCQNKSVLKDLKILGQHDEFTVYSTVAITNLSENPVSDLWDLARRVDGWGKIQIVDRLANMELNQQIKDWLILEGYKNNIMYDYLAFTCAVNGKLHEKLESEQIDKNLFKASADIIGTLIAVGGPAEDITSYVYASSAVENFIRHAKQHTSDISDFITLTKIKDFLSELQNDIGEQKQNGWTPDIISNCIIEIVEIMNSRDWRVQTNEGLKSKDNITYWNAKQAAEKLGVDLWETVWTRLQENPLDSSPWFDVTRYSKSEHADLIINFALENLPLDEMATGAKDSMGLGSTYSQFMCLDTIITYLENYPQKGERIILTGLKSPITRNRNMAIKVLDKWKRENWSVEIEKEIQNLKNIEPNTDTKENIEKLLSGKEIK